LQLLNLVGLTVHYVSKLYAGIKRKKAIFVVKLLFLSFLNYIYTVYMTVTPSNFIAANYSK